MSGGDALNHPMPEPPADRIGLCLSGGGFRAMLFHAGAVWRLSDLGLLRGIQLISGVSGGSIAAAWLGLSWSRLDFDGDHADALRRCFIDPLRSLADKTIDTPAVLRALVDPRFSSGERVAVALARHLFAEHTLQDLPDVPTVVVNAVNVQSLSAWRFSKQTSGDPRVGSVRTPTTELATAVAAAASYSPILGPVRLRLDHADFLPSPEADLQFPPYTTRVTLDDASSIDSLGVSAAWEACGTVLISDALKPAPPLPRAPRNWIGGLQRTRAILEYEMRRVRLAAVLEGFRRGARAGAYWGIGDASELGKVPGALPCPDGWERLAQTKTRLGRLDNDTQRDLINWGYATADAALRASFDQELPAPSGFPYA